MFERGRLYNYKGFNKNSTLGLSKEHSNPTLCPEVIQASICSEKKSICENGAWELLELLARLYTCPPNYRHSIDAQPVAKIASTYQFRASLDFGWHPMSTELGASRPFWPRRNII